MGICTPSLRVLSHFLSSLLFTVVARMGTTKVLLAMPTWGFTVQGARTASEPCAVTP